MGIKIAFNSRKEAREYTAQYGGKVKDSANKLYLGKRWIVIK